jgi:superoxide dismutase
LYICTVFSTNENTHTMKKEFENKNLVDIKRSIGSLRKLLADDPKRMTHKIKFKRYGAKYIITNKDNDLSTKLEKSFNSFMGKLNIQDDQKKTRGICFLDKKSDAFNIGYQKEGEFVLHQIKGKLG